MTGVGPASTQAGRTLHALKGLPFGAQQDKLRPAPAGDGQPGHENATPGWLTAAGQILAALGHPEGMLACEATSADGTLLPKGTYVVVYAVSLTGQLKVHAYSGFDVEAVIPREAFHAQPGLVLERDEEHNVLGPRDDTFQEYVAPLWDPKLGPRPGDADVQGALGDCTTRRPVAGAPRACRR